MRIAFDRRSGGAALLLGYLLVVGLLFWQPLRGLAAATASLQGSLYGGPYNGVFLFAAANYLAVFGLALALGFVSIPPLVSLLGVGLVALAVVALFVSFRALLAYLHTYIGELEGIRSSTASPARVPPRRRSRRRSCGGAGPAPR